MSAPEFNGCDWPIDVGCLGETWTGYSDEIKARAVSMASATLERLTGGRVTNCPVVLRPDLTRGICATGSMISPMNWGGTWCNGVTAHDPRVIELPGPVGRVDQVKVSGVVIDPSTYRIDNQNLLVWQGTVETCPWQRGQDLNLPDTEVGTFSITYINGYPPDGYAAYAAALLAAEFAGACGGKKCRLPSGVTAIVRQGVSYDIVSGAFPDGKTGIREIDSFIGLWNPSNRRPGMVFDPGAPRDRYRTV